MDTLDGLISELDSEALSDSLELEFAKMGQKAFDRLAEAVRTSALSERQARNAINLMFRLTRESAYGSQKALQDLCMMLSMDARRAVRSEAVVTLIRLTLLGEAMPQIELRLAGRESVSLTVAKATEKGLEPAALSYVDDFVAKRI
jgi:hypothetical protein